MFHAPVTYSVLILNGCVGTLGDFNVPLWIHLPVAKITSLHGLRYH